MIPSPGRMGEHPKVKGQQGRTQGAASSGVWEVPLRTCELCTPGPHQLCAQPTGSWASISSLRFLFVTPSLQHPLLGAHVTWAWVNAQPLKHWPGWLVTYSSWFSWYDGWFFVVFGQLGDEG